MLLIDTWVCVAALFANASKPHLEWILMILVYSQSCWSRNRASDHVWGRIFVARKSYGEYKLFLLFYIECWAILIAVQSSSLREVLTRRKPGCFWLAFKYVRVRHFSELSRPVRDCFLSRETCCRCGLPVLAFNLPDYSPEMSHYSIFNSQVGRQCWSRDVLEVWAAWEPQ